MKVTDNVTAVVELPNETKSFPVEITYSPRFRGNYDALRVKHLGFKQACLLNPAKVNEHGTYEMVLRFVDYFFSEFMGYGDLTVIGFSC